MRTNSLFRHARVQDRVGPERISLSRATFTHPDIATGAYLRGAMPVLIPAAASSWPAVAVWTPQHLAQSYGDLMISPSVDLPDSEVPYRYLDKDYRRQMTVRDFVALMSSGNRCYIDQMSIEHYPGLAEGIRFGELKPENIKVIALWMGCNTRSGLHYDYVDNLFVQVYGRKRAILVAPKDTLYLYPFGDNHTKSWVAPEQPDLARHPSFAKATLFEATLDPGDVLFIPKGWWHYLASSEASISLSCWFGEQLTPAYQAKLMLSVHHIDVWYQIMRDFIYYGVLGRAYNNRLYSLPPTGKMLYDLVVQHIKKRRKQD